MSEVKMIMVGDTNVGRPNPDSAFESVQHLVRQCSVVLERRVKSKKE